MSGQTPNTDRGILVFAIWGSAGFFGLGLFLEGLARDAWPVAAAGVAMILAAFAAHVVVNAIHGTGFSRGETALGIAAYGLLGLVFIAGAVAGGMSAVDYYAGLTLFGSIAAAFLGYLVTRHGLRGAFSQFHGRSGADPRRKRA